MTQPWECCTSSVTLWPTVAVGVLYLFTLRPTEMYMNMHRSEHRCPQRLKEVLDNSAVSLQEL